MRSAIHRLNKLAKHGHVKELKGQAVVLYDRVSSRVPFGTGVGTGKILALLKSKQDFFCYHPHVFTILAIFIRLINLSVTSLYQQGEDHQEIDVASYLDRLFTHFEAALPGRRNQIEAALIEYWHTQGFNRQCKLACQRAKSLSAACVQIHHWFDGFRTLKFIHWCRDQLVGEIDLRHAIMIAEFLPRLGSDDSWERILQSMREQDLAANGQKTDEDVSAKDQPDSDEPISDDSFLKLKMTHHSIG